MITNKYVTMLGILNEPGTVPNTPDKVTSLPSDAVIVFMVEGTKAQSGKIILFKVIQLVNNDTQEIWFQNMCS